MTLPTWAIALVLAFIAPFCARALGKMFEDRARARTAAAIGSNGSHGRRTQGDDA